LVISYIGYVTQEVTFGPQTKIDVILETDFTKLEEVLVVGYCTQKKENLTGSVATLDSKKLESRPVANVGQALLGQLSGLHVAQGGSYLENKPSFNICGMGSISSNSSNAPLVMIDGMEGDINNLNSNDIENISVSKDAAASSIYGAKAANGVILVTSKKGKAGKVHINYSANFRSSSPIRVPDTIDSYTWALMQNTAMLNKPGASQKFISDEVLQRTRDYIDGKSTFQMIPDVNNPAM
jgi:TonB-dependent SusC/RagA subfamily outer membrane receptor